MNMNRVKSMLYRQWMLERKTLLVGLVALSTILIIFIAVALSVKYGNLKTVLGGDADAMNLFGSAGYTMAMYMICYVTLGVAISSHTIFQTDVKANWTRFSIALPGTPAEHAFAFTLFVAIRMIAAYSIVILTGLVAGAAMEKPLTTEFIADMGFMSLLIFLFPLLMIFLVSSVKDAIAFKKQQAKFVMVIMALGVAVGLICSKIMPDTKEANSMEEAIQPFLNIYTPVRDAVKPFLIPAILVMLVLMFFALRRGYAKQKLS